MQIEVREYLLLFRAESFVFQFGTLIFTPKRDEVTRQWNKLHNEDLNDLYSTPDTFRVIKSRRMRWAGHVERMGERSIQGFGGKT
jgi:hypothetical protein